MSKKKNNKIDFRNYVKFPLICDEWGTYCWDQNYMSIFNFLFNDQDTKEKLVKKLNGEIDKKLKKGKFYIDKDNSTYIKFRDGEIDKRALVIRGWGRLTGSGGFRLSVEDAIEVQDQLVEYIVNVLNK